MAQTHFALHQPQSLGEVFDLLDVYRSSVLVLASALQVQGLVSLRRALNLEDVSYLAGQGLTIGGDARLSDVAAVPEMRRFYSGLAYACSVMATTIRNMGTVAGNLANVVPLLLVHDAQVEALSRQGSRLIPLHKFFAGPGLSVLEPGEIIVAIRLPELAPRTGSGYLRLSARSQVDIYAVGVAGRVAAIDDTRVGAAYRREMVEVLARRVLAQSLAQAAGPDLVPGGAA